MLQKFPEVQQSILDYDQEHYAPIERNGEKRVQRNVNRRPHVLWKLLVRIVKESKVAKAFLIIDALDECDELSQQELISLFSDATWGDRCIQILFSSRPNEEFGGKFSYHSSRRSAHFRRMKIEDYEDEVIKDLDAYVDGELSRLGHDKVLTQAEQDRIRKKIAKERAAVFLPVALLFREIEQNKTRSIAEILEEIPRDLRSLYIRLIEKLPETHCRLDELLRLLVYAFTPVTLSDIVFDIMSAQSLQMATLPCIVSENDSLLARVRHDLRHLTTITRISDRDVVSFVHVSAKQFLVERSEECTDSSSTLPTPWQSHRAIAIACLRVIIMNANVPYPSPFTSARTKEERSSELKRRALLNYALRYWFKHLKKAFNLRTSNQKSDQTLVDLVEELAELWNHASPEFRWTLSHRSGIEGVAGRNMSLIEIFSGMGLEDPLKDHISRSPRQYRRVTPIISNALRLAIQGGHESTFDILIDHFHITSLDEDVYTGLMSDVAWSRNFRLMRKALKLRRSKLYELVAAVSVAFSTGERATLDELTKTREVFNMRDHSGRTALHLVFIQMFKNTSPAQAVSVMEALGQALFYVSHGVDINARDGFGLTALHYACWCSDACEDVIIKGLIKHGADPFVTSNGGLTPLHFAVRFSNRMKPIHTLLQATSNVQLETKSKGGNTPLHWAVRRRPFLLDESSFPRDEIARGMWDTDGSGILGLLAFLIRNGADPYVPNRKGTTPLQWAADTDRVSMLQELYEKLDGVQNHALIFSVDKSTLTPQRPARKYLKWLKDNCLDEYHELDRPQTDSGNRFTDNVDRAESRPERLWLNERASSDWPLNRFEGHSSGRVEEREDKDGDQQSRSGDEESSYYVTCPDTQGSDNATDDMGNSESQLMVDELGTDLGREGNLEAQEHPSLRRRIHMSFSSILSRSRLRAGSATGSRTGSRSGSHTRPRTRS